MKGDLPQSAHIMLLTILTSLSIWVLNNFLLIGTDAYTTSLPILPVTISSLLTIFGLNKYTNNFALSVICIFFFFLLSLFIGSEHLVYLLYLSGTISLIWLIRDCVTHEVNWARLIILSWLSALTSLTIHTYTSFNMVDRLHAGLLHQDTLSHASIAAMIKTYGVASTGLK